MNIKSGSSLGEVARCSFCLGSILMYSTWKFTSFVFTSACRPIWVHIMVCDFHVFSLPLFKCFDLYSFFSFSFLYKLYFIPYDCIFHWFFSLNFTISVLPLAYTHTLAAGLACLAWPLPACRPTARPAWLAAVRSPLPPQTQREEAVGGAGGNGGGGDPQGGTGAARHGGVGAQRRVGLWMHRLTPTPHP